MNGLKRWSGHLSTITRHRNQVLIHCIKAGIPLQGLLHDLSKYSPTEFLAGVRYYDGTHSPTEDERREQGYSRAWIHHKGRNRHHWEYWTDYDIKAGRYAAVPMPPRYVAEMICDRVAASKIYKGADYHDGCPLAYLTGGKLRDEIHPQTLELLTRFLTQLKEEGEEAMFASLKAWVKANKQR